MALQANAILKKRAGSPPDMGVAQIVSACLLIGASRYFDALHFLDILHLLGRISLEPPTLSIPWQCRTQGGPMCVRRVPRCLECDMQFGQ